jgi:myosin heavy subunit
LLFIDEECAVPKGSDEKFVSKINQIFDENTNTKSLFFQRNHKTALSFTIRHFAGDVHYNAGGFLEKNRDVLAESLMNLLQTSSISMIKENKDGVDGSDAAIVTGGGSSKSKKSSKLTLSGKFKSDLDQLMITLRSTSPHFVRCIKPNVEQIHTKFDCILALNQLKYSGLFEAIRIRKAGYEVRIPQDVFILRYRHVCLTIPKEINRNDNKKYCEFLLNFMNERISKEEYFIERKKFLEKNANSKKTTIKQSKEAVATAAAATVM